MTKRGLRYFLELQNILRACQAITLTLTSITFPLVWSFTPICAPHLMKRLSQNNQTHLLPLLETRQDTAFRSSEMAKIWKMVPCCPQLNHMHKVFNIPIWIWQHSCLMNTVWILKQQMTSEEEFQFTRVHSETDKTRYFNHYHISENIYWLRNSLEYISHWKASAETLPFSFSKLINVLSRNICSIFCQENNSNKETHFLSSVQIPFFSKCFGY